MQVKSFSQQRFRKEYVWTNPQIQWLSYLLIWFSLSHLTKASNTGWYDMHGPVFTSPTRIGFNTSWYYYLFFSWHWVVWVSMLLGTPILYPIQEPTEIGIGWTSKNLHLTETQICRHRINMGHKFKCFISSKLITKSQNKIWKRRCTK